MLVASLYAPRPTFPGIAWAKTNYDALLLLVDASCRRLGFRHVVISDAVRPEPLETALFDLPENLMQVLIDGQRQFLAATSGPVLMIGADCLLTRDPRPFVGGDLTVTVSSVVSRPLNTGMIWCADGLTCAPVWQAALDRCPREWGEDQIALYASIKDSGMDYREIRCEEHNSAPSSAADRAGMPTVAHFKGPRKSYMAEWARRHLAIEAAA